MSDKKITIEEVKHIARLSKLNIPDNELEYYSSEMDKLINHFNILSKVFNPLNLGSKDGCIFIIFFP